MTTRAVARVQGAAQNIGATWRQAGKGFTDLKDVYLVNHEAAGAAQTRLHPAMRVTGGPELPLWRIFSFFVGKGIQGGWRSEGETRCLCRATRFRELAIQFSASCGPLHLSRKEFSRREDCWGGESPIPPAGLGRAGFLADGRDRLLAQGFSGAPPRGPAGGSFHHRVILIGVVVSN